MKIDPLHTAKQIVHYVPALVRHLVEGQPVCTQEEVNQRYAICLTCVHQTFVHGYSECELCLCHVNRDLTRNKLYWANEKCPDQPSRWEAIKDENQPVDRPIT